MNGHKNEVHLVGVLAKEPQFRTTPTGKHVATISLMTKYKTNSELHRIVLWEKLTDKIQNLPKGELLEIVGRLQTRSWDDAGQRRYITEVVAIHVTVPGEENPPNGKQIADAILRPASDKEF